MPCSNFAIAMFTMVKEVKEKIEHLKKELKTILKNEMRENYNMKSKITEIKALKIKR